ncbi:MmgE/PrpD family protein [Brucellaceae bacterium C25G]
MSEHPSLVLARNVAAMSYDQFPAATIHKAKIHILDTLGASIAGVASPETRTVLQAFNLSSNTGKAEVWGSDLRLDSRTASFVNGVSAHAFELDDSGGCDHSGAVVLPAAFAALRDVDGPVSGKHFLTAIIAGYEVGRRVLEACGSYSPHNELGWHSTGTCGVFGAAAAASVLFGFDAEKHASAYGIACSYSGGTWAFIHDGSQTKKLHAGRAAEGGLIAAKLTASGFNGPVSVFDTTGWGNFFTTFDREGRYAHLLNVDFGTFWRVNRCSIKPYATCRGTHSAIDVMEKLLSEYGVKPDDIERIDVMMSEFQAGMCGGLKVESRADAQMSLPYALSARLVYGKVSLDELEEQAWTAPVIAQWLSLMNVHIDEAMDADAEPYIKVTLKDGTIYNETVPFPLGGMDNPMSDEAVIAKFMGLATRVLPEERCIEIRDYVLALENAEDVSHLAQLIAHSVHH